MDYVKELEEQNEELKCKLAYLQHKCNVDVIKHPLKYEIYLNFGKIHLQLASIYLPTEKSQFILRYMWNNNEVDSKIFYPEGTLVSDVIEVVLKRYDILELDINYKDKDKK